MDNFADHVANDTAELKMDDIILDDDLDGEPKDPAIDNTAVNRLIAQAEQGDFRTDDTPDDVDAEALREIRQESSPTQSVRLGRPWWKTALIVIAAFAAVGGLGAAIYGQLEGWGKASASITPNATVPVTADSETPRVVVKTAAGATDSDTKDDGGSDEDPEMTFDPDDLGEQLVAMNNQGDAGKTEKTKPVELSLELVHGDLVALHGWAISTAHPKINENERLLKGYSAELTDLQKRNPKLQSKVRSLEDRADSHYTGILVIFFVLLAFGGIVTTILLHKNSNLVDRVAKLEKRLFDEVQDPDVIENHDDAKPGELEDLGDDAA